MRLSELVAQANERFGANYSCEGDVEITAITQDSREVQSGSLFAAINGTAVNGEDYIGQAITQSAAAILCHHNARACSIPSIRTDNPRQALSHLAASFYGDMPDHIIAVTGTDGKTSVAEFVRQLLELCGHKALSVGTLGLRCDHTLRNMPVMSDNTTPEPVKFYQALAAAKRQGVDHIVCEASSHGLAQYRLDGLAVDAAIFTSFAQDHLDYHGSMQDYFAAKTRLFSELLREGGAAILCNDYSEIATYAATLPQSITYGKDADASITAITPHAGGQRVTMIYNGTEHQLDVPLFGSFQIENMIAAMLATNHICAMLFENILPHCTSLTPIKGRLELAGTTASGTLIFVDYAHTAGALHKALTTLRDYAPHQLHVVFGCGGDRDAAKRPHMGKVAHDHADHAIITDDNPRTEDPATIRTAIAAACPDGRIIPDRPQAIHAAIDAAHAGDVVLVAGKGHENYQIIGTTKHHCDDVEIVQDYLHRHSGEGRSLAEGAAGYQPSLV